MKTNQLGVAGNASSKLKEVEAALELVSQGLLVLEKHQSFVSGLTGSRAVDIGARLNASQNALERAVTPLKDSIKVQAIETQEDALEAPTGAVVPGLSPVEAVVRRVYKNVLIIPKVREFLGKKVSQFTERRPEIQVSFRVRG